MTRRSDSGEGDRGMAPPRKGKAQGGVSGRWTGKKLIRATAGACVVLCQSTQYALFATTKGKNQKEHHARPRRTSATAPQHTAHSTQGRTCAKQEHAQALPGSFAGARTELDCRRSNHERTKDPTGWRTLANTAADTGSPKRSHSDSICGYACVAKHDC